MNAIVRLFAARPVAVIMMLLALILSGVQAAFRLPLGRLPELNVPRVLVEASIPGLPAAEVRALVAIPLEDALASAKNLSGSSSVSRDGMVVVVLDFRWGEDASRAAGRVSEILDAVYPSLPEGAAKPTVVPYNADREPLIIVTVAPMDDDLAFAGQLAEYEVRSRLRRVEGVGIVTLTGGLKQEVAVSVDMRKAAVRGLTVHDVAGIIARESADSPVGSLREGDLELVAMAKGRASDVEELSSMVAFGPAGPFMLSEIATLGQRNAPRNSIFVASGEEKVALEVYAQTGSDPVATARRVSKVVLELAAEFADVARIELVKDASLPIAASIRDLAIAGIIGAIAAAAALFAFLGDLKAGILVASSIPISIAVTLGALDILGYSLNMMSLGGMGLAIGMISDNAVVVHSALSSSFSGASSRPDPGETAAATGAALSGTFGSMITTSVVFVPVFFLPGAIGGLFGDMAASIIIANLAGWLIAVLALPALYRLFWTPGITQRRQLLESAYRKVLRFALRHQGLVLTGAGLAALCGAVLTLTRPVAFMPPGAMEVIVVRATFPAGTDPDGLSGDARKLSGALASVSGVTAAFGSAGSEIDDTGRRADPEYSMGILSIVCPLGKGADTSSIQDDLLRAARVAVPGNVLLAVAEAADPVARLLGLERTSSIAVRGSSAAEAIARADALEASLLLRAGTALGTLARWPSGTKPQVLMSPLRDNAASLGISLADAALAVRAATEGVIAARLDAGGRQTDVRVFAAGAGGASGSGTLSDLGFIPVLASGDSPVSAATVADFTLACGTVATARLDRADVVYIQAEASPGQKTRMAEAVESVLSGLPWAELVNESAFHTYGLAMAGAVVLVLVLLYLTLGAQFESFRMPVLVMATIPLAMAGTGPLLLLTGIGLDSGSILGLIVLFGVVVNNAILLFETSSARVAEGAGAVVAAYRGASERARPVLATTMTTVAALIPLCVLPSGTMQRSISVTMLGGLIASTVLTLFVSPMTFASGGRRRP